LATKGTKSTGKRISENQNSRKKDIRKAGYQKVGVGIRFFTNSASKASFVANLCLRPQGRCIGLMRKLAETGYQPQISLINADKTRNILRMGKFEGLKTRRRRGS